MHLFHLSLCFSANGFFHVRFTTNTRTKLVCGIHRGLFFMLQACYNIAISLSSLTHNITSITPRTSIPRRLLLAQLSAHLPLPSSPLRMLRLSLWPLTIPHPLLRPNILLLMWMQYDQVPRICKTVSSLYFSLAVNILHGVGQGKSGYERSMPGNHPKSVRRMFRNRSWRPVLM